MMEVQIKDLSELTRAADTLIDSLGNHTVVVFDAEMGAGKTTLIAEICRRLGVEDEASSPTFAIVNEYRSADSGALIYHFDCYRIEDSREAEDMGIEDYFYSGALCLVEWPDRVEEFLPDDALRVGITVNPDGSRTLRFDASDSE